MGGHALTHDFIIQSWEGLLLRTESDLTPIKQTARGTSCVFTIEIKSTDIVSCHNVLSLPSHRIASTQKGVIT